MFSPLRVVGLLLVFGGFGWLANDCFISPAKVRPVIGAHFDRLPAGDTVTMPRRDMLREIHDIAAETLDNQPNFFYPGCVMLLGGLILGFAPMRRVHNDGTVHI